MTDREYPYTTFQISNLTVNKCTDCTNTTCTILYDRHHDLHFSHTCGKVIMQSGYYHIEYTTNPYYWENEYQRRREIQELKTILHQLKELKKKHLEINIKEMTITIHDPLTEDDTYLIERSCRDTSFKLTEHNEYYIIQKEKTTGAKRK